MGTILAFQWDIRHQFHAINAGPKKSQRSARVIVLFYLSLCANQRLRCWPSMDTIAAETGISLAAATEAKEWLIAHDAMILVPRSMRQGDEVRLPKRSHIYQLTGFINLNGTEHRYLLMSDEVYQSVACETKAIKEYVSKSETSNLEVSDLEVSESATKVNTSSEVGTNPKDSAPQNGAGSGSNKPEKKTPVDAPKKATQTGKSRDVLFDWVTEKVFRITAGAENTSGGRIARISKYLAGFKVDGVGELGTSAAATVEELNKFVTWYGRKNPNISLPWDAEKFSLHFLAFRSEVAPKQTPGGSSTLVERERLEAMQREEARRRNELLRQRQTEAVGKQTA